MTFRASTYAALPEGVYDAVLEQIEEGTNEEYGPFRKWTFTVETDEGHQTITAVTSVRSGPKSKAYRWASTLLGRKPGEEDESLAGLPCRLHLIVNEQEFNRVESLLPPAANRQDSTINLDRLDNKVFGEKPVQEVPF